MQFYSWCWKNITDSNSSDLTYSRQYSKSKRRCQALSGKDEKDFYHRSDSLNDKDVSTYEFGDDVGSSFDTRRAYRASKKVPRIIFRDPSLPSTFQELTNYRHPGTIIYSSYRGVPKIISALEETKPFSSQRVKKDKKGGKSVIFSNTDGRDVLDQAGGDLTLKRNVSLVRGRAIVNLTKTDDNPNFGIDITACKGRIVVTGVKPGSPAYRNDIILPGDTILNINGYKVGKSVVPRSIENLIGNGKNHIQIEFEYVTVPKINNAINEANIPGNLMGSNHRNCTYFVKHTRVKLRKDDKSSNYGFTVRGGRQPIYSNSLPFFVTNIRPGGPADREGSVKPGDRLICIDNLNLDNTTLTEVLSLLRHYNTEAMFTFAYDTLFIDYLRENQLIHLTLHKPIGSSLGIGVFIGNETSGLKVESNNGCSNGHSSHYSNTFDKEANGANKKTYLQIKKIKPASIADRCGVLSTNDFIVAIEGVSTRGMYPAEALKLIKYNIDPSNPASGRRNTIQLDIFKQSEQSHSHPKPILNGNNKALKFGDYEICCNDLPNQSTLDSQTSVVYNPEPEISARNPNCSSSNLESTSQDSYDNYSSLKSNQITDVGNTSCNQIDALVANVHDKGRNALPKLHNRGNGSLPISKSFSEDQLSPSKQSSVSTEPRDQLYHPNYTTGPQSNYQVSRQERTEVRLLYGSRGLGLALQDKEMKLAGRKTLRTFISNIEPGGVAEKSGILQIGDAIIEVNHLNVDGLDAKRVADLIRNSKASGLGYRAPLDKTTKLSSFNNKKGEGEDKNTSTKFCMLLVEYSVGEACKPDEGLFKVKLPLPKTSLTTCNLGLSFDSKTVGNNGVKRLFIRAIAKGSIAERCGLLNPNDFVLSLNGYDVRNMNREEVSKLLAQKHYHSKATTSNTLEIEIQRGNWALENVRRAAKSSKHYNESPNGPSTDSAKLSNIFDVVSSIETDLMLNSTEIQKTTPRCQRKLESNLKQFDPKLMIELPENGRTIQRQLNSPHGTILPNRKFDNQAWREDDTSLFVESESCLPIRRPPEIKAPVVERGLANKWSKDYSEAHCFSGRKLIKPHYSSLRFQTDIDEPELKKKAFRNNNADVQNRVRQNEQHIKHNWKTENGGFSLIMPSPTSLNHDGKTSWNHLAVSQKDHQNIPIAKRRGFVLIEENIPSNYQNPAKVHNLNINKPNEGLGKHYGADVRQGHRGEMNTNVSFPIKYQEPPFWTSYNSGQQPFYCRCAPDSVQAMNQTSSLLRQQRIQHCCPGWPISNSYGHHRLHEYDCCKRESFDSHQPCPLVIPQLTPLALPSSRSGCLPKGKQSYLDTLPENSSHSVVDNNDTPVQSIDSAVESLDSSGGGIGDASNPSKLNGIPNPVNPFNGQSSSRIEPYCHHCPTSPDKFPIDHVCHCQMYRKYHHYQPYKSPPEASKFNWVIRHALGTGHHSDYITPRCGDIYSRPYQNKSKPTFQPTRSEWGNFCNPNFNHNSAKYICEAENDKRNRFEPNIRDFVNDKEWNRIFDCDKTMSEYEWLEKIESTLLGGLNSQGKFEKLNVQTLTKPSYKENHRQSVNSYGDEREYECIVEDAGEKNKSHIRTKVNQTPTQNLITCTRSSSLRSAQLEDVKLKHLNKLLNLSQTRVENLQLEDNFRLRECSTRKLANDAILTN